MTGVANWNFVVIIIASKIFQLRSKFGKIILFLKRCGKFIQFWILCIKIILWRRTLICIQMLPLCHGIIHNLYSCYICNFVHKCLLFSGGKFYTYFEFLKWYFRYLKDGQNFLFFKTLLLENICTYIRAVLGLVCGITPAVRCPSEPSYGQWLAVQSVLLPHLSLVSSPTSPWSPHRLPNTWSAEWVY